MFIFNGTTDRQSYRSSGQVRTPVGNDSSTFEGRMSLVNPFLIAWKSVSLNDSSLNVHYWSVLGNNLVSSLPTFTGLNCLRCSTTHSNRVRLAIFLWTTSCFCDFLISSEMIRTSASFRVILPDLHCSDRNVLRAIWRTDWVPAFGYVLSYGPVVPLGVTWCYRTLIGCNSEGNEKFITT